MTNIFWAAYTGKADMHDMNFMCSTCLQPHSCTLVELLEKEEDGDVRRGCGFAIMGYCICLSSVRAQRKSVLSWEVKSE